MGGASSGEVASAIAAETIPRAIERGERLSDAIAEAHHAILAGVADGRGGHGMGSTAVVLRIVDDHFELGWIGDSRGYRFDGQRLERLSHDHSFVQALIDQGGIGADEAATHPARHMLTRVLGGQPLDEVEPDEISGPIVAGQRFLLCSDGLTEELSEPEIAAILAQWSDPDAAVRALVEATLQSGGSDNVTVVLVCVQ
jgi:protein phosphatase